MKPFSGFNAGAALGVLMAAALLIVPGRAAAAEPWKPAAGVAIPSVTVRQGEPARIVLQGIANPGEVLAIGVNGALLRPLSYGGQVQSLYGVDLNQKPATLPVIALLSGQRYAFGMLTVTPREKPTLDFTIPDALGGTNPQGEQNVRSLLARENAVLAGVRSEARQLWSGAFRMPVADPVVTDPYGYSRDTGTQLTAHKGTDFRAAPGTEVRAINGGVVRMATTFSIYGKTVIVDHGQGLLSFYMHLSEIGVAEGAAIRRGDVLGRSGQTGYAEGPHLHLTVRANGTSVDPLRLFELFGR